MPSRAHTALVAYRDRTARLALVATAALVSLGALGACGGSAAPRPVPSRTAAEPQTAPPPTTPPNGIVVPVGDTPEGVVIDDALDAAVVALRRPDSVALVGLGGTHALRRIATPGRARHLRLAAPDGPLLLPGEDVNTVFEIALPTGTVTARYPTGHQPHDAVEVDGHVWVTDELAGRVSILGGAGSAKSLPAGLQPGGLDTAAGRVAVADVRGNALYVFDVKTQRQVAVLPAGAGPTHVERVGPTTVAVADTRGGAILLYDLSGHPRQLFRLPLPGGPYGLAADPTHHRLWVALSGRNELLRLDIEGTRLRESSVRYATVQQPNSVAVSAKTGALVVAGATAKGTLQLLNPGS
jgi:DNA-binding beta-propeller fold protein YncE